MRWMLLAAALTGCGWSASDKENFRFMCGREGFIATKANCDCVLGLAEEHFKSLDVFLAVKEWPPSVQIESMRKCGVKW